MDGYDLDQSLWLDGLDLSFFGVDRYDLDLSLYDVGGLDLS